MSPIFCIKTSVQLGSKRLSPAKRPKYWRCELTALSVERNLYFVACDEEIHVYQPAFPDQFLSKEPTLVLHPPKTSLDLQGTVDPSTPHSITRLIIDHLGRDEVVLVACDDGDVIGYRVADIWRALEECPMPLSSHPQPFDSNGIRVFLHRNVGESAWGLAVHQKARLIAISANTHSVTVIAYALTTSTNSGTYNHTGDNTLWSTNDEPHDFPYPRHRDHVITLRGTHNIPSISFNNNGDDPGGRWLFSSAIDGRVQLWDLHHTKSPVRTFEIGRCVSTDDATKAPRSCSCPDNHSVPHAAWATMIVDPRSCHEATSNEEAFGTEPIIIEPCFWDISRSKQPPNSDHVKHQPFDIWDSSSDTEESEVMTLSDDEDSVPENQESDEMMVDNTENYLPGSESSASPQNSTPSPGAMIGATDSLFIPENPIATSPTLTTLATAHTMAPWTDDVSDTDSPIEFVEFAPSDFTVWHPGAIGLHRIPLDRRIKKPYCQITVTGSNQVSFPPTPFLIITKEEIHLLQTYLPTSPSLAPIITLPNPLFRANPNPFISSTERHCFSTQIPELGIFIVASPGSASSSGKAALFRLTKTFKPDDQAKTRPIYGFRMDHIVGLAGALRLVGIAVGPVQGMMMTEKEEGCEPRFRARQWRLLMYYQDHSVVSYELGVGREEGGELGDVVV